MGIKARLAHPTHGISPALLRKARHTATKEGKIITFEGHYEQGIAEDPKYQINMPFVIGQTERQRASLAGGVLEGRTYEGSLAAEIRGKINVNEVRFEKTYDPTLAKNPYAIFYEGVSIRTDGGISYAGKWHFHPNKECDMETEGTFIMSAIDHKAIRRLPD